VREALKTRPPRGALAVIAVGLLGCLAAAVLSTDKPIGAATLEWVEKTPLPDSAPAAIPGGGSMQLTEAGIRATEANAGGFTLYRVAAALKIDAGAAIGHSRLRCAVRVPKRTIVAKTSKSRASYPRSSEDLIKQPMTETSLVQFSSHSTDLAVVELGDALGETYTRTPGITVEWAPFQIGQQVWRWGLPGGRPAELMRLPFASVWRTTSKPAAWISCTIETGAGKAMVRTAGSLPSKPTASS
jgi:hypothetical protein